MSDGVPPWRRPTVGAQVLAAPRPKLELKAVAYGFPLELEVHALVGFRLEHFSACHAKEEGVVGGGEVEAVTALEADDVGFVVDEFDCPAGFSGGAVSALAHGLLVVVGDEVLVEVAAELDGLGGVEELHGDDQDE